MQYLIALCVLLTAACAQTSIRDDVDPGAGPAAAGSAGPSTPYNNAAGSGAAGAAGGATGDQAGAGGKDTREVPAAGSGDSAAGSGGGVAPVEPCTPVELKYDCPLGADDLDCNGYPDACEQVLWTSEEARADGSLHFPTYVADVDGDWDPSTKAGIALTFPARPGLGVVPSAAVGAYDSIRDAFEPESHELRIFDPATDADAKRIRDQLLPSTGRMKLKALVTAYVYGGKPAFASAEAPVDWKAQHLVYFECMIDGAGYDANAKQLSIRGGWRIRGY